MTQEQKDLLLKDLCSRIPYGVRGFYKTSGIEITSQKLTYDIIGNLEYKNNVEFKPYLFPLSSMTEKQRKEYEDALTYHDYVKGGWTIAKSFDDEYIIPYWFVDFCNKNHFDYRGLIEKGLAIEASEGMYN